MAVRPWSDDDQDCADQAAADARLAERLAEDDLSLAIARADTEEAVGLIAVRKAPQEGVAGLVFWVRPGHRRRGLATRAVWLVTGHALDAMAVARLEAWVQPADHVAAGVLRRCGFLREGLLRSFLVVDGLRVDVHVYSRLARELSPYVARSAASISSSLLVSASASASRAACRASALRTAQTVAASATTING